MTVAVQYLGVASAAVTLPVVPSMAGLFTANSSGTGQASIVNQDGTTNSSSNAAALGSTATLYGTGMGAASAQVSDGTVPQNTSVQPALPVSVTIDSIPAQVVSAYAAPGMLGVLVVNVQVPASAHGGAAIPIAVQVGTSQSQQGTTMATHYLPLIFTAKSAATTRINRRRTRRRDWRGRVRGTSRSWLIAATF